MLLKELIIHCIQKHPCIWDISHESYKNGQKKEDAYKQIASFVSSAHGSLEISSSNVKTVWELLEKDYKAFLALGKKVPQSGAGSFKETTSNTDYDLFKIMNFLDQRYKSRPSLTSTGVLIDMNNKRPDSIWQMTSQSSVETKDSKAFIMPEADQSSSRKKARLDKNFQQDMKGIFGSVKELTEVIKTSVQNKISSCDDAYKKKINDFFKNLNDDQRDALMEELLNIIVNCQVVD